MIQTLIAKFYEIIIVVLIALLLLALIGFGIQTWRANHWEEKAQNAKTACYDKIDEINQQHRKAIDDWREKVFVIENELEAERNNIKVVFRDIKHETQKIITSTEYSACKLSDDGMSVAEAARIAANNGEPP